MEIRFIIEASVAGLAVAVNLLALAAVINCKIRLPGFRRFLISLTSGDLYVALVHVLTIWFQVFSGNTTEEPLIDHPYFKCGANVLRTLQLAGFFINLLNLCGMSLDHFVGIAYPLKYQRWMTGTMSRITVVSIWIFSFALAFMDIPINILLYRNVVDSVSVATQEPIPPAPSPWLRMGPVTVQPALSPNYPETLPEPSKEQFTTSPIK